jgi:hypothetical protein
VQLRVSRRAYVRPSFQRTDMKMEQFNGGITALDEIADLRFMKTRSSTAGCPIRSRTLIPSIRHDLRPSAQLSAALRGASSGSRMWSNRLTLGQPGQRFQRSPLMAGARIKLAGMRNVPGTDPVKARSSGRAKRARHPVQLTTKSDTCA